MGISIYCNSRYNGKWYLRVQKNHFFLVWGWHEQDKADHLFWLMDINGVCHIVFCGRLEACFRGQTVVSIAYPCSVLVKPCKSRTFQPLTVHTRPPLPFSQKRLPAPFLRRVPALARSPDFGTFCPEVARCGASPAGVFLFGRSFCFQGAVHRWTTLSLHLNDRPSRISER